MTSDATAGQGLTSFSRFVLYGLVLPLLFIAGLQLFILAEQTETYFAWTFASPLPAAFMGAGYWAAMLHAYTGAHRARWEFVRSSLPGAVVATTLLTLTTFVHLDRFHLNSPLLITRFVTWVWIAVYIFVPPILAIAWITQSRLPGANVRGEHPLPGWIRGGFLLLAGFALICGSGMFVAPDAMSAVWPWALTPLAGRANASWINAFGVTCASLVLENDVKNGAGTGSSLFAFCVLQLIVVARYAALMDWSKPLAVGYLLFLMVGVAVTGGNWVLNRR